MLHDAYPPYIFIGLGENYSLSKQYFGRVGWRQNTLTYLILNIANPPMLKGTTPDKKTGSIFEPDLCL